jgi:hypothetical protein
MSKSGTVALLTLIVMGCAAPEKVQAPEQIPPPEQVKAPEQLKPAEPIPAPKQVQTPKPRPKRVTADQERVAAHLQHDLGPICTAAGLTPGTDAHSRCMESLYKLELERKAGTRVPGK